MNNIKYGLVLSGGGVRGIAHIGVIKALEEQGIKPEIISGSSAGAIVGAFYAAGYSIDDMIAFWRETHPFTVRNYTYSKAGFIDTEKLQVVFQHYFPEDSFEALKKKLFIATTNMVSGNTRYFDRGQLIHPLLASAAVPGVFSPVIIDGKLYADGGVSNNFPIEPIISDCDKIIGVDVNPLNKVSLSVLNSTVSMVERAFEINRTNISSLKLDRCQTFICPSELNRFGTFRNGHVDEIFQIGYEAALKKLEAEEVERFQKLSVIRKNEHMTT